MRIARFSAGDEVAYGLVGMARPAQAAGGGAAGGGAVGGGAVGGGAAGGGAARGGAVGGGPAAGGPVVAELGGHPFGGLDSIRLTGSTYQLDEVRLLAPVLPSKVICFGTPWPGGAGVTRGPGGDDGPVLYLKPSTAVCGQADVVRYPAGLTQRVEASGELAVVIGRLCRQVPPDQADAVIFGYTCALNVTARDLAERDGQWARAAGFDTFCPLGPWIETESGAGLALTTTVNGAVRQRGRLRGEISGLVASASAVMTLLPGDVLLTGLPADASAAAAGAADAGAGAAGAGLEPGDEVSVTIEGIGTLTNRVDKGD